MKESSSSSQSQTPPKISKEQMRSRSQFMALTNSLIWGLNDLRKGFKQERTISQKVISLDNEEQIKLQRTYHFMNLERVVIQAYLDDRGNGLEMNWMLKIL